MQRPRKAAQLRVAGHVEIAGGMSFLKRSWVERMADPGQVGQMVHHGDSLIS